jgi:hypothetical protein
MASVKILNTASKRVIKIDDDCRHRMSQVIYKLPFRIKITNITVPGYIPLNPPPIGLAIIGINNYIL